MSVSPWSPSLPALGPPRTQVPLPGHCCPGPPGRPPGTDPAEPWLRPNHGCPSGGGLLAPAASSSFFLVLKTASDVSSPRGYRTDTSPSQVPREGREDPRSARCRASRCSGPSALTSPQERPARQPPCRPLCPGSRCGHRVSSASSSIPKRLFSALLQLWRMRSFTLSQSEVILKFDVDSFKLITRNPRMLEINKMIWFHLINKSP